MLLRPGAGQYAVVRAKLSAAALGARVGRFGSSAVSSVARRGTNSVALTVHGTTVPTSADEGLRQEDGDHQFGGTSMEPHVAEVDGDHQHVQNGLAVGAARVGSPLCRQDDPVHPYVLRGQLRWAVNPPAMLTW